MCLSDIASDDKATRVTYGILNLTHRNRHAYPEYLKPGERYQIQVQLNGVAQVFPAGHRLRLSVSTSYFPLAWPPPEPVRLAIYTKHSNLMLPVRPSREIDSNLSPMGEPEVAPSCEKTLIEPRHADWWIHRNLAADKSTLEIIKDDGKYRIEDIELAVRSKTLEWYSYQGDDFESVRGETLWDMTFEREDWRVRTVTRTILTASNTHFHVQAEFWMHMKVTVACLARAGARVYLVVLFELYQSQLSPGRQTLLDGHNPSKSVQITV